jgi:hypothetical protein
LTLSRLRRLRIGRLRNGLLISGGWRRDLLLRRLCLLRGCRLRSGLWLLLLCNRHRKGHCSESK